MADRKQCPRNPFPLLPPLPLSGIGRYANNSAGPPFPTSCALCPVGRYNIKTGQGACDACASGKFSAQDRSSCGDCDAGTFVYNDESCETCPAGTYSPQALADACLDCSAGFHTGARSGATTCTACNGGTFSEGLAVNCTTCGAGTYSGSSSASCTDCDAGKYEGRGKRGAAPPHPPNHLLPGSGSG